MTRQPLKPGSDQIISAGHVHRELERTSAEPPAADVHVLEIIEGELPGRLIVVEASSVKVGRWRPPRSSFPTAASPREHCVVGLANDELLVTDLNSTNGTYIDDVRISRATILPVGSVLRLGQITLHHVVQPAAEAERRSADVQAERVAAAS